MSDNMDMKLNFDIDVKDLKELDKITAEIQKFVKGLNKADDVSKEMSKNLSSVGKLLEAINKRRKSAEDAQLRALELQLAQNKEAQKGLLTEKDRAKSAAQRAKIAQRERELEHNAARLSEDIAARTERRETRNRREAAQETKKLNREKEAAKRKELRDSDYLWKLRERTAKSERAEANREERHLRKTQNTLGTINQFLNRQVGLMSYKGRIEQEYAERAMKTLRSQTAAAILRQRADTRSAKSKMAWDKAEEQRINDRFTNDMKMARRTYNSTISFGSKEQQADNARHRARMRNEREFQRERERAQNEVVRGAFNIGSGVSRVASQGRNAGIASIGAAYGAKRIVDRGLSTRMDIDTAETNMKIFGEMNSAEIKAARGGKDGLDAEAIKNGLSIPSTLSAFNEVKKAGLLDPMAQTKNLLAATTALELDVKPVTKLMGTMSRNMGASATPERLKKTLNAIAVGAREDPTQSNEIVEGMNRAQGVLAMSSGVSEEDLVALVSGGQSVGIQPGKAGTFMSALARDISLGGNKFLDKKKRKELNFAARKLGFGSAKDMAARFAGSEGKQVLYQIFRNMKGMDPAMRSQVANALSGGMWGDEDMQMVNGYDGMVKTDAEIHDPKNKDFLDEARTKKVQSWAGMWAQTKTIFSRFWESFGLGFDSIIREINSFFLDINGKFNFDGVETIVKDAIDSLRTGLGFKSWKEALQTIFPTDVSGYGSSIREFFTGFGEGVRGVFDSLKSVGSMFGVGGAGGFGKLAGQLMTLSIALMVLSPLMSVIGALSGAFLAMAGVFRMLKGGTALVGIGRLLLGGSTMAEIGALGAGGAAAAGWPIVGTLIATAFVKYLTSIGTRSIDDGLGINPDNAMSFSGLGRMLFKPGGIVGYAYDYFSGGNNEASKPNGSTTQQVIENTQAQIKELERIVDSVSPQKRTLDKIEENTREGARIQKQSFDLQEETDSPFKGLIHKASIMTGGTVAAQVRAMGGSVGGGGGGGFGGGSVSGPAIASSVPGGSLGNGLTGMRRRGIIGGGGSLGPEDDGTPVSGALNPRLAGARKSLMDELDSNPGLRRDVIKTASMENRGSPLKMQAVIESMVNRAKMNGYTSLNQAIHSGFYGPVNRGGLRGALSEKDRRDGEAALAQVKAGSNMIGYRTDQGMLTDPGARKYMREADHSGHKVIGGENFFYMGQKGRAWAKRQEALDAAAGAAAQAQGSAGVAGNLAKKAIPNVPAGLGDIDVAGRGPGGGITNIPGNPGSKVQPRGQDQRASGGGGGGGNTIHVQVNAAHHSPEEMANAVQRKLQDSMNRRTHDYEGFA